MFMVQILKLYFGIICLNLPQGSLRVGILGTIIDMTLLLCINIFSTYLMIKARNRYKMHEINNISQLALVCIGREAKYFTDFIVLSFGVSLTLAYNTFFA
jgi:amino acid permease